MSVSTGTHYKVFPVAEVEPPLSVPLLEAAKDLELTPEQLVEEILYNRGRTSFAMPVDESRNETLLFVPGHVWGAEPTKKSPGPRQRSDVMVIDKMLDYEAVENHRLFSGDSGRMLAELFEYSGHTAYNKYYVTSMLKTRPPDQNITFKQNWVKDQIHLLYQEIFLVRPKHLLLMGADVVKAMLGRNMKLVDAEGRIHKIKFFPPGEKPFTARAIVTMRPEALVYERHNFQLKKVRQQFGQFKSLISGKLKRQDLKLESPPGHIVVDNYDDMIAAFKKVRKLSAKVSQNLICVDCEWQGQHPQWHGAYLRCIQVSGGPGQAVCIALTHPGGKPRFKVPQIRNGERTGKFTTKNGLKTVIKALEWLFKDRRPCGHSLKSDLEWLEHYGMDLSEQLYPPEHPKDCKTKGGFCTLLAAHAYDEQAELGLTEQLLVHLPHIPNYDATLQAVITDFCSKNKIKKGDLGGYGELPDEELYTYANWDVDAGIQLALFYLDKLDRDQFGNACWTPYHISYRAMFVAHEITKVGIRFDAKAANRLTFAFIRKRNELLEKIRTHFNWPDLNMDSPDQMRELLFGTRYNGKPEWRRLRPPGARSMMTMPILSTGKYQKNWMELREAGEDYKYNASCNRVTLGLLTLDSEKLPVKRKDPETGKWVWRRADLTEELKMIREFRLVNQQLKGPLRPPTEPPPSREDWDPDEPYYEKGIPGSVCDDGRVRTTILQIKETGRWSSISPPLMNLCLDEKSEYLTDRGWVPVAELKATDKVAQYWPDNGSIDFVVPDRIIKQHYEGDMVHLHGEQVDMMMTPNHRHIFKQRRTKKLKTVRAEEIVQGAEWQNIHAGEYSGGTVNLKPMFLRWLVAVQADGNYERRSSGELRGSIVFTFKKKRKSSRLQKILDSLGIKYTRNEYPHRGVTTLRVPVAGNESILASTREWLPDKKWSKKLLTLRLRSLRILCKELPYWDGLYDRKTQYYSSIRSNSDWMQIVWTLCGIRAKLCKYQPKNPNASANWQVNIPNVYSDRLQQRERYDSTTIKKHKVDRVKYSGFVYCVTVPSSYMLVRRNGMVSVTGNSSAVDKSLQKLFGDEYPGSVKEMFIADEDWFLVPVDLGGAELRMTAVQSQDQKFIWATECLSLPEEHPDHMDIHSSIAVSAFKLPCKPIKSAVEKAGFEHLRTGAKTVIFGKFYGQSVAASVIAVRTRGTPASYDDLLKISETFDATYPDVNEYFREAQQRVEIGYLATWAGRYRRFPRTSDKSKLSAMKREALNAPVQGGVADFVSKCCWEAVKYRKQEKMRFKVVLQKHDELMFLVPRAELPKFYHEGAKWIMSESVSFWAADFEGRRIEGTPDYKFFYDIDVCRTWGKKIKGEELEKLVGVKNK